TRGAPAREVGPAPPLAVPVCGFLRERHAFLPGWPASPDGPFGRAMRREGPADAWRQGAGPGVRGAPEGSTRLALSASGQALIGTAYVGSALTAEGWRLFDERRRSYLGQPLR